MRMPFYRFMVHGRDPIRPADGHGFYTTRHVCAPTLDAAANKVLQKLEVEFTKGRSAAIWDAPAPILNIEQSWQISIWKAWTTANTGSTFYDDRIEDDGFHVIDS